MFSKLMPIQLLAEIGIGFSLIASTLMLPAEKAQASSASGFSQELFKHSDLNYTSVLQVGSSFPDVPIAITGNWTEEVEPRYLTQNAEQYTWTQVSGQARDIGIGGDGSVWILGAGEDSNGNSAVYQRSGSDWERIGHQDGWGTGIDAGPNELVAIFDRQGNILILNYGNWIKTTEGQARGISIGGDSSIWILGWNPYTDSAGVFRGYRVWTFDATIASNWRPYDAYGVAIDVDREGSPWIIDSQGEISYLDRNNNTWMKVPGQKARQVGIGGDGSVWIVGWDFNSEEAGYPIYRRSGSGWEFTNAYGVAIDVAPRGTPWIVNQRGEIFYLQSHTP